MSSPLKDLRRGYIAEKIDAISAMIDGWMAAHPEDLPMYAGMLRACIIIRQELLTDGGSGYREQLQRIHLREKRSNG